jgi:predicted acylesterase/phospholipase RssA
MQQYLHKKAGSVSLFITSDNNTVATISIPGVKPRFREEIELQADELVRVDLPISVRMSGKARFITFYMVFEFNDLNGWFQL